MSATARECDSGTVCLQHKLQIIMQSVISAAELELLRWKLEKFGDIGRRWNRQRLIHQGQNGQSAELTTQERAARADGLPFIRLDAFLATCGTSRNMNGTVALSTSLLVVLSQLAPSLTGSPSGSASGAGTADARQGCGRDLPRFLCPLRERAISGRFRCCFGLQVAGLGLAAVNGGVQHGKGGAGGQAGGGAKPSGPAKAAMPRRGRKLQQASNTI